MTSRETKKENPCRLSLCSLYTKTPRVWSPLLKPQWINHLVWLLPQAATPALSTGGMHMALLTNAWSLVMWPPSQF